MSNSPVYRLPEIRDITREQFDALFQISRMLNEAELRESLVEDALDLLIQVIQAERGLFARYDPEKQIFSILSARNIEQEQISDLSEFSSGILQQVVDRAEPCLYHDVQSDPDVSQFESVQIRQITSVLGVPVFKGGKIWGVILVDSQHNRREFTEENLLFLRFFSNLFSLALERIDKMETLRSQNLMLQHQLQSAKALPDMIGESPSMKKLARLIHKVAETDATVLVLGESGTGKDLAARAIHELSPRKGKPFLAQFCGSIPDTLLESELFGYKKGAFTGAVNNKKGLFEAADHGTFFLDEIADISTALQAKLLRVIQNQEIIRLGDTSVIKINVRLIAATNKDLRKLVDKGLFREDLFYRLNVFPITVPALRERSGDVLLLARHFIRKFSREEKTFSAEAIKKMESYAWPGNVRELENTIQRSLILTDHNRIEGEHIILEEETRAVDAFAGTLKELEKSVLLKRLDKFEGNRTLTAKSLGVSVRWIQLKLKEINNSEK